MHSSPGKAWHAPFRVIVFSLAVALGAGSALAQAPGKPGPMQSGRHASEAVATRAQPLDVGKLFATSCGWCHSDGGRAAGKGPQLMGSELTDEQLVSRIRNGRTGQMPAFSGAFTEQQMRAIVAYIRNLKPKAPGGKK